MNVNEILEEMTLEEKARLVNGATFFGMAGVERLGIPRIQMLDGGTGINFEQLFGDIADVMKLTLDSTNGMVGSTLLTHVIEYYFEPEKLTEEEMKLYSRIKEQIDGKLNGVDYAPGCFPPGILLGATWSKEAVREIGEALGKEACLYGVHVLLGTPNVNIHRDPLNGRLFEGYSEDPYLVSVLAPELVMGVQKYGVAANVKHFAANNQETNRVGVNETISLRALEEIYFPGFKACVQDGEVKTVMSAYNRINGVPCTENKWLLTEKLREEWGFDGVVLSDWGAVYHPVEALRAGNDLAMPGPRAWEPVAEAVKSGDLDENELNLAVKRLLEMIDWITKSFGKMSVSEAENMSRSLMEQTDKAAYRAAAEGMVLVENAGILPLNATHKTAVIGSGAEKILECGSGSAGITTNRTSDLKEGIHVADIGDADVLVFVSSLGGMEGNDRPHMHLDIEDIRLLHAYGAINTDEAPELIREQLHGDEKQENTKAGTKDIILVLNICGPVDLSYINRDVVKAVLVTFLPGMQGGRALSDILTGKINPSGKLPITFPKRYEDTPTYLNFPGDGYEVCYGEGIYVGYRYYDKKKIKPLYPFGHGLSYTSFMCSGMEDILVSDNEIRFVTEVENTGKTAGAQVVQIYVSDPYSTLQKPVKELKAFKKVYLKPGEKKRTEFQISFKQLESYDSDLAKWTLEEGYYDIIAATSSAEEDVFARERIYIDCSSTYSYGPDSTVKTIYERSELREILRLLWKKKEWDWGIVESNYQYTSNKKISEILPDCDTDEKRILMEEFAAAVQNVRKP